MAKVKLSYDQIAEKMVQKYEDVHHGKMMSSPALVHNNKVFAFYYGDSMVFKLGKDYDMRQYGEIHHEPLNPFKNKAPMLAWFVIGYDAVNHWDSLAEAAYKIMKEVFTADLKV